jgi:hypothetical protein
VVDLVECSLLFICILRFLPLYLYIYLETNIVFLCISGTQRGSIFNFFPHKGPQLLLSHASLRMQGQSLSGSYIISKNYIQRPISDPLGPKGLRIKFISICIWKKFKFKCFTIATCIVCLIYTISIYFSCRNNTNPFIHIKHMESVFLSIWVALEVKHGLFVTNHFEVYSILNNGFNYF